MRGDASAGLGKGVRNLLFGVAVREAGGEASGYGGLCAEDDESGGPGGNKSGAEGGTKPGRRAVLVRRQTGGYASFRDFCGSFCSY